MFRINPILAGVTTLLALCAGPALAKGGCAEFGAPDWRAPLRAGAVEEAWPLKGADRPGWGDGNARVIESEQGLVLEVRYPEGSINPGNDRAPEGGLGFWDRIYAGDRQAGCLSYQVKFERGFRWAKGGKLPGLWGGGAVGGCARRRDLGFSTRYMWTRSGDGFLYSYFADRKARCGEAIFPPRSNPIEFETGRWHKIEQLVILNTPGKHDGVLKVWFNGELMIDRRRVRYRDRAKVKIDGLMFSTFFGGASRGNASPREQRTWFRGFEYRALNRREAQLAR